MFGSEIKRKYALLISLWSEAKNSKRNEAKRSEHFFSRERAKRMRNGSRFASFRFEAKSFFGETGAPYSVPRSLLLDFQNYMLHFVPLLQKMASNTRNVV